jgi:hypothetical protein
MAKRIRKPKCKNCHDPFPPDPRNAWHQEYCRKPECRKASKAASQKRWLSKEENQDYFRSSENVQRMQEWRRTHPGHRRIKPPKKPQPLQDVLIPKTEANPPIEPSKTSSPNPALQDLLNSQNMVLIGLIAHLTGSALQDDIVLSVRRLRQLADDIFIGPTQTKGGSNDPKAPYLSTSYPEGPQSVQLGGSPFGP